MGVARRCESSPYGSNIVVVGKKGGGYRVCCDFRFLNEFTVETERFPLPNIDASLKNLAHQIFFFKIGRKKCLFFHSPAPREYTKNSYYYGARGVRIFTPSIWS